MIFAIPAKLQLTDKSVAKTHALPREIQKMSDQEVRGLSSPLRLPKRLGDFATVLTGSLLVNLAFGPESRNSLQNKLKHILYMS